MGSYYTDKYGGAPTSYGNKCGGCDPGYECITIPGWGGYGQESPDTHECKPTAETRARWAEERKAANAKAAAEKKAALNAIAENTGSANALLANTKYTNWYDRQYGVANANIGTIRSRLYNSGNKEWLKYTNAQWKEVAGKVKQTRKAKANANAAKAAAAAAAAAAKAEANAAAAAAKAEERRRLREKVLGEMREEAKKVLETHEKYKRIWNNLINPGSGKKSYIHAPQDQSSRGILAIAGLKELKEDELEAYYEPPESRLSSSSAWGALLTFLLKVTANRSIDSIVQEYEPYWAYDWKERYKMDMESYLDALNKLREYTSPTHIKWMNDHYYTSMNPQRFSRLQRAITEGLNSSGKKLFADSNWPYQAGGSRRRRTRRGQRRTRRRN